MSSLLAWAVGDPALAVRIAGVDDLPPGEEDREPNPASDLVLGLLDGDPGLGWEGRAERLIRTARPAHDDFVKRLTTASRLLLAHGEPLAAACLFYVMRKMQWTGYSRPQPECHYAVGWLGDHMVVEDDEHLTLVKDLQEAGIPGTIRFDGARFRDASTGEGSFYIPPGLAALRTYAASLTAR